jgi:hypothetical protein
MSTFLEVRVVLETRTGYMYIPSSCRTSPVNSSGPFTFSSNRSITQTIIASVVPRCPIKNLPTRLRLFGFQRTLT